MTGTSAPLTVTVAGTGVTDSGDALAAGGQYDAVFFGHNHVFSLERFGRTPALNPGSVMGAQFSGPEATRLDVDPTFAIYDSVSHTAQGYSVSGSIEEIRSAE